MTNILIHLIEITSIFSVLYLLYMLFLRKFTFHTINRLVLLLLPIISLIIPFLGSLFPRFSSKIVEIPLFENVPFTTINQQIYSLKQPLVTSFFSFGILLTIIYWIVVLLYFTRFFIHTRHLFKLKRTATIKPQNGYQLVSSDVSDIFSYFNWIFIPKDKLEDYPQEIIEHEKVHIQLKHSWDVIFSEVHIAFFWFNPLSYFYRKSLKSVHEFQADKGVLQRGIKTSQYMQLLIQNLEIKKPNALHNYFNQNILENRIAMMTKPKSSHLTKLIYLLLLPVCVFLISAFTSPIIKNNEYLEVLYTTEILHSPPSLFPVQNETKKDIVAFFGTSGKQPINEGILHGGIDIEGKSGTPVLATADGIINKASFEGNWGNLIVITHDHGYETWYAHLKDFNTSENQIVKKGDIIGYLGATGRSTGPHLHYEVKQNGKRLNPIEFF